MTETAILFDVKSALVQGKAVYQDDSDFKHRPRWKPYLLTTAGILYHGIVIKIDQQSFKTRGFVDTPYGIFTRKALKDPVPCWWLGFGNCMRELAALDPDEIPYPTALAVLGLSYPFSQEELKTTYRQLVKQHHPDQGGDAERFMEIQAAYELLENC